MTTGVLKFKYLDNVFKKTHKPAWLTHNMCEIWTHKSQVLQLLLVSHYLSVFPVGDARRNLPLLLFLHCHLRQKGETLSHIIFFGQCKYRHLDFFSVAWKHWKPCVPFCLGNAWQERGEMEVLEESSCWSWNIQSKDVESLQTEGAE